MALTRPKIWNQDTNIEYFRDPITVLHQGATSANVDVGFIFNRANGLVSNVALVWSESAQSMIIAYTGNTGVTDTNVSATSYANVTVGNISVNGVFWSNGTVFSSGSTFTGGYVANQSTFGANLVANSGVASSSNVTGAVVVSGGLGVSGSINVGTNLVFSNGSNPGISKPIGVRMDINNAGGLDANNPFWSGYHFNTPDGIISSGGTGYPRMSFYWNYNSANNPNNINFNMVAGNNATGGNANVTLGTDTAGYVRFLTNNTERLKIGGEGNVVVTSTTASTSTTTGALVVAGGAGVAGNIYVAGNLVVGTAPFNNTGLTGTPGIVVAAGYIMSTPSGTDSMWTRRQAAGLFQTQTFNGSNTGTLALQPYGGQLTVGLGATTTSYTLDVAGTANVSSNITIGGNIASNSTTVSTGTTTGALVVAGGAGIGGALYIANTGDVSANIGSLLANAGTQGASINIINANIGAYYQYANANLGTATTNITTLFSNAAAQATTLNTHDANIGVLYLGNVSTQANLGAYQTYANGVMANFGPNVGTLYLGNISTQANLGAYQTYANTTNNATQANIGAFYIYANANLGTATTNITTLLSNAGTQQTQINNLVTNANANVAAYLPTYSGAVGGTIVSTNFSTGNAVITGGSINATTVGATTKSSGGFTTLTATGATTLTSGTESLSTATGALVVTGGVGVSGNLWIGGNLYVANVVATTTNQLVVNDPLVYFQNPAPAPYNFDIGFYSDFVGGPVNAYGHSGLVRQQSANAWVFFSNVKSEPTATSINWADAGIIYDALKTGDHIIANTTVSTSTTTGALQVSGGAGIAGALYITNTGDVSANIGSLLANAGAQGSSINTTNANIGVLYLGNISTQANLGAYQTYANTTNNATQANIGVLYLGNVSTQANLGAYQTYANTTNNATQANIGTLFLGNTSTQANLGAYQNTTNANIGTIVSTTIPVIQANLGAFETYANTKIGTNTNSNLVVVATTTSTSTTTGALVVAGGVGIAGDTYAGGNLTVGAYSSNTRANLFVYTGVLGTTSGASIVMAELNNNINGNQSYLRFVTNRVAAGSDWTTSSTKIQQRIDVTDQGYIEFNPLNSNYGVDIGNGTTPYIRVFQGGNVVIPTTTTSTSTTTGALVVAGGAGIAGRVSAGNIVTTSGVYWANGAAYSSGSSGGMTYTTSTSAPVSPSAGNFWYDSSADKLYQYINDGTSSSWVDQSFPTSFANLAVTNNVTAGTFSGSGSGLTNIPASQLSGSTLASGVTASSLTSVGTLTGLTVTTGNTAVDGAHIYSVNAATVSQLTLHATSGTVNRQSKLKFTGTFYNTPGDVGERYVTSIRSGFDSTSNAWGSEFLGVYVNNTTNDANSDANQTLIATFSNYGGLRTSSNLVASNGSLYSQNLLLQGDGTNAYIRPTNASSTLYLGANNTNIALINTTGILPTANVTYNLGSSTAWWSTVYGKAVQAQYADLAEHYTADATYPPGTVVVFGGTAEITTSDISHDPRTAGVISTDPAYLMNASTPGLPVALTGRVPCRVQGPVDRGDRLVNISAGVAGRMDKTMYEPGCIVGKSLEAIKDNSIKLIEIAVGRY